MQPYPVESSLSYYRKQYSHSNTNKESRRMSSRSKSPAAPRSRSSTPSNGRSKTPPKTPMTRAKSKTAKSPKILSGIKDPAPTTAKKAKTPRAKTPSRSRPSNGGNVESSTTNSSSKSRISSSGSNSKASGFSTSSTSSVAETIEYEFGGPLGAFGVVVGLPVVVYLLYFLCNNDRCMSFNVTAFDYSIWEIPTVFFTTQGCVAYLGWMAFNVFLERILPGEAAAGAVLPDYTTTSVSTTGTPNKYNSNKGVRLVYTLSAHLQFWICILLVLHALAGYVLVMPDEPLPPVVPNPTTNMTRIWAGLCQMHSYLPALPLPLELIYDHYVPLISISVVFTTVFSIYLYVASFALDASGAPKLIAKGGNTGNVVYDFFIGRELNPRWGSLDLKEFCELRPGLIGWLVINIGMAAKQHQLRGSISMSMILTILLQGLYVWDACYNEKAILTTMDITTDGFGFMLCYGDLSWVPFIYTLQARYLVDYDPNLSIYAISIIVAIHFIGYYIFRSANSEKDAFRRDPDAPEVQHLTYLQTKRGTKLLTSGWWGLARKINYTGDWLVTLAWCLLCGFDSPIPYFQAIYFLVLLVHRAIRDDKMCEEKYGDDWLEYKRLVPYWFIPGVI